MTAPAQGSSAGSPWLVAGLGNPGSGYAGNRHNVGLMVVELLAERAGARFRRAKARAQVAEVRLAGARCVLARPLTYMNESGTAVAGLRAFYKAEPARTVVVHDELDLEYGQLRLKVGGGDNGHNGLRSIRRSLGTGDYPRVRFGIGRPPGRMDPADFVLRDFSVTERKELSYFLDRAADAVESLLANGLEVAQNAYHAR